MTRTRIDIVLPCYNPGNKWHEELIRFYYSAKNVYDLHFILVNDGSQNSNNILQQIEVIKAEGISIHYLSYEKNMGKGYALRKGVAASTNPFVLYTDIDFPFTDQSTLAVIQTLVHETCDLAVGYRADNYYKETMSFYRKILSRTFRFFIRRILGMSVSDTQCGLKAFNENGKAEFLRTTINRYLFDFEFIYSAGKTKTLVIKTVEVRLKDNIVFSKMRLKILMQEVFNLLRVLLFKRI